MFRNISLTPLFAFALLPLWGKYPTDVIETKSQKIILTAIEHATLILETKDVTIYVDPVQGKKAFKKLPRPTVILLTHIHPDHLSLSTLKEIREKSTTLYGPPSVVEKVEGCVPLEAGKSSKVGSIEIAAVPAYNTSEERLNFHPKGRDIGYLVTVDDKVIYISGDTEETPEMKKLKNVDVAFLCMNLPYTMSVEQAAAAVVAFKPRVVYPYHYRGKEGMSDLDLFVKALKKEKGIEIKMLDWYGQ